VPLYNKERKRNDLRSQKLKTTPGYVC